jgi:hypothetical protein
MTIFKIPSAEKFTNRSIATVIALQDFIFAGAFWVYASSIANQTLGYSYVNWQFCLMGKLNSS